MDNGNCAIILIEEEVMKYLKNKQIILVGSIGLLVIIALLFFISNFKAVPDKKSNRIIDDIFPEIILEGPVEITIGFAGMYNERGFKATDNIDGNITDKVVITGEIKNQAGSYLLTYTVVDSSGNSAKAIRKINVTQNAATITSGLETKTDQEMKKTEFKNEIVDMSYIKNGIKLIGVNDNRVEKIYLLDIDTNKKYEFKANNKKNYNANLDLTKLDNGTYEMYMVTSLGNEKVINKLDDLLRLGRAKLGDKLITFKYKDDHVQLIVTRHNYIYDILIDVGHGGEYSGAVNSDIEEKDMNLIVSLYEKKRYEDHGLRVGITRTDDEQELYEGDAEWRELSRRAYGIGYHGVLAKIVYSNHHNGSEDKTYRGPEILVPASYKLNQLTSEVNIMKKWVKMTPNLDDHVRFYTRDYDTETVHNKINGETYNFTDYYALIRLANNLFNVKVPIFEPAYMSNASNFKWYWKDNNWKKMSEIKIREYVEALGITYKEPVG